MDMFFVDRLTKWRTRSISPTSGKGGGASARAAAGSGSAAGTSDSGVRWQRRPGLLISNSRAVDWFFSMYRFRPLSPEGRGEKNTRMSATLGDRLAADAVQGGGEGRGQAVDLGPRPLLGDGHRQARRQLRIPAAQCKAGVIAVVAQPGQQTGRVGLRLQRELLEERAVELQRGAR